MGRKKLPASAGSKDVAPPAREQPGQDNATSCRIWWKELAEDDPITLEPLANLELPPFELASGIAGSGALHYFDPVALATYLTSRGIFENPLTRELMGREDCARLDAHLEKFLPQHRKFRVAEALDLQRSIKVAPRRDGSNARATALRREATAALHGLFTFGAEGMRVIDDDLQREQEADEIAARNGTAGEVPDVTSDEQFPVLTDQGLVAGEAVAAAAEQRNGDFVRVAEAAAEAAQEEAEQKSLDAWARQLASKAARAAGELVRKQQAAALLERIRLEEAAKEEAARKQEAAKAAEAKKHAKEWREAEHATAEVQQALAAELESERLARARQKRQDEEEAKLATKLATEAAEEEAQAKEEHRKEKELEKQKKRKERLKQRKEDEKAEKARQKELEDLEAKKQASGTKCGACQQGILDAKKAFEVNGLKFCNIACVQKYRSMAT